MGAYRGLAAVLFCLCLPAQERANDALFDFMYAKFSDSLISAKDSGEPPEFLVLANPGISLDPAQMKTPSYEISLLLDQVPQASRSYSPSGNRYSTIYQYILDNAVVTDYQVVTYRDQALDAKRMLFDKSRPGQPSADHAAFMKYRAEYQVALEARTTALAQSNYSKQPLPPGLDQAIETARKNWETLGSRAKIQKAMDALQKAYDTNAMVLFQSLRTQVYKAELRGTATETWLPVTTYPPVEEWLSGRGWHPWLFNQTDLGRTAQAAAPLPGQTRPDPKAGPDWNPAMSLSVEVKRVNVSRPWMDPGIFKAHTWLLKGGKGPSVISSGNPADKDPGPMPILVTGILLARKLTLTGYQASLNAEGRARIPDRIGPFDLGGLQAGRKALNRLVTSSSTGIAITVPDPQIIAFFCQAVPKSPTPDRKFFR